MECVGASMTEEEYFRKTYPNSCYGDRLLSPYWDYFQDGVEFGERQSEKKIAELEQENNNLLDVINNQDVKIADLEKKNEELKKRLVFARAEFQRQYKENAELKKELAFRRYAD